MASTDFFNPKKFDILKIGAVSQYLAQKVIGLTPAQGAAACIMCCLMAPDELVCKVLLLLSLLLLLLLRLLCTSVTIKVSALPDMLQQQP